ncbi:phosphoglycerate mutase [Methanosarcina sp. MSH10X1]|uniref:sulfatase-like hydrolase/transferase n=1 Tax=Methanosarcina sp. MSH10X1 TaxID=2507075 RepID=UPI000FFC2629|nr:sulfatase-like hydrolase/transferase [Methanosarcina sp. MSH10X1]RXA21739.1 phosphoglycerate mutase [Methanosarcina sp. MSH10X1]
MIPAIRAYRAFRILFFLALLSVFFTFAAPASALTEVEVNPVSTPQGAVVLIVDGLSAPFIYPELTPYALDGTPLEKAELENLPEINKESARLLEFRAPQTFTEGGHSVLVTGNPGADSELVSFKDATVFDILHSQGYLCIAVMEKGDSWSVCDEQDAILRDENNSIKNMEIVLEQSEPFPGTPRVPDGLLQVMESAAGRAPGYVVFKETRDRYNGYNRWGIDTACEIVEYMSENSPGQEYLLTVNAGAVDMSGHYRDNYGYIDCIECLDSELLRLYELCKKNNLAFVLTSDHGMSFSRADSKGGHQSEKFSVTDEAQLVPLIVHAEDVETGILREEYYQEDFAPTLLGILDIPDRPRFAEGKQILLTDHVNLKVELPEKGSAELRKDGNVIAAPKNDDQFLFLGLEPGSTCTVRAALDSGKSLEEQEKKITLETDSVVEFTEKGLKSEEKSAENKESGIGSGMDSTSAAGFVKKSSGTSDTGLKHLIGYLAIGLVNLAGLLIIAKILKKAQATEEEEK